MGSFISPHLDKAVFWHAFIQVIPDFYWDALFCEQAGIESPQAHLSLIAVHNSHYICLGSKGREFRFWFHFFGGILECFVEELADKNGQELSNRKGLENFPPRAVVFKNSSRGLQRAKGTGHKPLGAGFGRVLCAATPTTSCGGENS